jgi:hypothetical protein
MAVHPVLTNAAGDYRLKYCIMITYASVIKWIMLATVLFLIDQYTLATNKESGNIAINQYKGEKCTLKKGTTIATNTYTTSTLQIFLP